MSTKMMVTAGVCAAALVVGAGLAMSGGGKKVTLTEAGETTEPIALAQLDAAERVEPAVVAAAPKPDCREVATAETGFDPATTPYPVREDAGNKQVLKGAAVGAAVGAVGGELITDRAGIGAAVGAGAGALGGHAIKKSKQNAADERYEAQVAAYNRSKAQYDAALATCLAT